MVTCVTHDMVTCVTHDMVTCVTHDMVTCVTHDMVTCVTHDMVTCVTHDMVTCVTHDMVTCVTHDMVTCVTHDMVTCVTHDMVTCVTHDMVTCVTHGDGVEGRGRWGVVRRGWGRWEGGWRKTARRGESQQIMFSFRIIPKRSGHFKKPSQYRHTATTTPYLYLSTLVRFSLWDFVISEKEKQLKREPREGKHSR